MEMSLDSTRAVAAVANELIDARLRTGSTIRFTVPTASMSPTLLPGDQVIVRKINPTDLHSGDIVLVRVHETWIAHRLISRSAERGFLTFVTKGDNSAEADCQCSTEDLRGIVEIVEHDGCQFSFRTGRARRWGAWVAQLSRFQSLVSYVRPHFLKRVLSRGSGLVLWAVAVFAKQAIG